MPIPGNATDYDFGSHFNYATWLIGTQLTLTNVPWNNDYRDILVFDSPTGLDDWIDDHETLDIANANVQKFQTNVKINTPINAAMRFNYLRARNPLQPSETVRQTYYYFVQDVIYRSFNSTELVLQLDVWATFGKSVSFGSCYVERGHIGIANSANFQNYGRDYLTEVEGMDIGGEYRTIHVENTPIINSDQPWILVCSTIDLTADPGTITNPLLKTATGSLFQGIPSGAAFYYFKSPVEFFNFMRIYTDYPWVTQGIISVTAIPPLTRYYDEIVFPAGVETATPGENVTIYPVPTLPPMPKSNTTLTDWRSATSFMTHVLGLRYGNLKKFFTYPYLVIELTTFTGSPVILKPEMWQDADATIRELSALVPPGQRVLFSPYRYNASGETLSGSGTETETDMETPDAHLIDDYGDFLDIAASISNFPQLALVNNMAIGFLAANKNGLAFQFASADWGQQRALAGAQAGVDIANTGIRNTSQQSAFQNTLGSQQLINTQQMAPMQMIAGAMGQIGGGGIGGATMGGGVGAAAGALGGSVAAIGGEISQGMSMQVQQQNLQAAQTANGNSAIANIRAAGSVRDTNADYARFAAKGDYAMNIRAVQAKIQDAKLNQPSVSGQFGGDAFNMINNLFGYSLRWKFLNAQHVKIIGDYWLRYGYAINQFVPIPTNFKVMSKFTYWKLAETYIAQAPIPESFKQTIRGIFEKGVTVWSNPDDIGNIDWADNDPISATYY